MIVGIALSAMLEAIFILNGFELKPSLYQ